MAHIHIEFNDKGQAEFDIKTDNDSQIFTALLGIEAYIGAKSELPVSEIRSIMDEMKNDLQVKGVEPVEDNLELMNRIHADKDFKNSKFHSYTSNDVAADYRKYLESLETLEDLES